MRKTLFLFLGYPGSGKSTFSIKLADATGAVRVNSDELRTYMFEDIEDIKNPANNPGVFGALDYATELLLSANLNVIHDANNNRREERDKARRLAEKCSAEVVVLWVKTPLSIARQREAERILPDKYFRIPPDRYDEIISHLEEPAADEKVIFIDGLKPFEEQYAEFKEQLGKL